MKLKFFWNLYFVLSLNFNNKVKNNINIICFQLIIDFIRKCMKGDKIVI